MHKEIGGSELGIGQSGLWRHQFIFLILATLLFAGCEKTHTGQTSQTSFTPGGGGRVDSVPDGAKAEAIFSGGDGSTAEQAVVIAGASGEKNGIQAEYVWLHERYPGYRLRNQFLRNENGKLYDEMRIVTKDDKPHTIFFDITSFFGK